MSCEGRCRYTLVVDKSESMLLGNRWSEAVRAVGLLTAAMLRQGDYASASSRSTQSGIDLWLFSTPAETISFMDIGEYGQVVELMQEHAPSAPSEDHEEDEDEDAAWSLETQHDIAYVLDK